MICPTKTPKTPIILFELTVLNLRYSRVCITNPVTKTIYIWWLSEKCKDNIFDPINENKL